MGQILYDAATINHTIKNAPVQRHPYDSRKQLGQPLNIFISARNFICRLKILESLTPSAFICPCWTAEPERFTFGPLQRMPGLSAMRHA